MDPDTPVMCPCGRPLHYANPESQARIERMIRTLGPEIPVTILGRTWLVSRHYIALHGLRAADLPALGFPEITPARN